MTIKRFFRPRRVRPGPPAEWQRRQIRFSHNKIVFIVVNAAAALAIQEEIDKSEE